MNVVRRERDPDGLRGQVRRARHSDPVEVDGATGMRYDRVHRPVRDGAHVPRVPVQPSVSGLVLSWIMS